MKESLRIIKRIESELKEIVQKTETEIMKLFPPLLSYDLMTSFKRYISHEANPPWDHSGSLYTSFPDVNFDLADYEKVEDFFEQYTGNSMATYISHHGLHHETYREKYTDWFEEQYRNAHYGYLRSLESDVLSLLAMETYGDDYLDQNDTDWLINDLIDEIEGFEDDAFIHAEALCSKISEMDLLFVYKMGEKEAKERILQEHIAHENAVRQLKVEKEAFCKRWVLLEKKYRFAFQKPFPKRIEMPEFEAFKQFLDQHHVSKEERVLISKYAPISFSNSVFYKLNFEYGESCQTPKQT